MCALLDKDGVFVHYCPSRTVDLKIGGTILRESSPAWEALKKGIPVKTIVKENAYFEGSPVFVVFTFPIKYKDEILGATMVTIDMTNNQLIPAIIAGIEEMRAASEEIITSVQAIREVIDNNDVIVKKVTGTVEDVSSNAGKLNEIKVKLNDLGDKIGLLALNAAIEAARAGEQGKGLGVVADEIVKLNDQNMQTNKGSALVYETIINQIEVMGKDFKDLQQSQVSLIASNDTLSSMYEELNAQIEQLTKSITSLSVGQEAGNLMRQ